VGWYVSAAELLALRCIVALPELLKKTKLRPEHFQSQELREAFVSAFVIYKRDGNITAAAIAPQLAGTLTDASVYGFEEQRFREAEKEILADYHKVHGEHMPWEHLLQFDPKHDPDCLFGNRYLGRGDGALLVAQSGVGKSVLGFQWGACAALGRPIMGLKVHKPLRTLLVQAEDGFGDVAEEAQGFVDGFKPAVDELIALSQRFRIERWNDVASTSFLARLEAKAKEWPFDFLIINPLLSFAGCNLSDQKEASAFFRNGLNPILCRANAACLVIHHTGKPPKEEKNEPSNDDLNYLAFGSSELTNWARSIVTLQAIKSAGLGTYKLIFGKRGGRAGIVDESGNPTRQVYVEHAKSGLCWLPSDWRPELAGDGKFKPKFDMSAARALYDPELPWKQNEAAIAKDQQLSGRAVRGYRRTLEAVY